MNPTPPSFAKSGFFSPAQLSARGKVKLKNGAFLKPLLIGTEGMSDSGKTRWALTAPGVIEMVAVDRNFQGVFDGPGVEGTNSNVYINTIQIPLVATAKIPDYQKYYSMVRDAFYSALDNPDSSVVVMDGDSDFWELHILAHFGKLTQIYPATRYTAPYAEKRAQITRARDSGKIVICSNKVRDEYEDVLDDKGNTVKDPYSSTGDNLRKKTGGHIRQGFKDQDYLWDLQLRHLYQPAQEKTLGKVTRTVPAMWGISILKCKHDMEMVGQELWGDQCNFRGLIDLVYPEIDVRRWGFDS